jgi:hypothetical protein
MRESVVEKLINTRAAKIYAVKNKTGYLAVGGSIFNAY